MAPDNHDRQELLQLLSERRWGELCQHLRAMDPADTADFLEEIGPDERELVFERFDPETASDVLVELEPYYVDDVTEDMPSEELANYADEMAPDDAADFLNEFDADESARILSRMQEPDRVADLLRHESDTAGHVMTTELCAVPATATVEETRKALAPLDLTDPVLFVYVLEPKSRRLEGIVSLQDLFTAKHTERAGDIADREFVAAFTYEDQEAVALKFRKYDVWEMPVLDYSGRLKGRITVDDIMDVIHAEADEDLAMMVGAPDIETEEGSPFKIARLRLPWLLITMFGGLINSLIIKSILDVTDIVVVAIFVPAIMAMGGNTGVQSAAIAVRGIALGYNAYTRLLRIVGREISVGVFMGLVCGTATAVVLWSIVLIYAPDTGGLSATTLALTVGTAMCTAMIFASCFGSIVPITMHRLGADPAVASGPLITTSNDLAASLIYFATCVLILR